MNRQNIFRNAGEKNFKLYSNYLEQYEERGETRIQLVEIKSKIDVIFE